MKDILDQNGDERKICRPTMLQCYTVLNSSLQMRVERCVCFWLSWFTRPTSRGQASLSLEGPDLDC